MTKTYEELREQTDIEDLNEFRVIRAGATLVFASKVREQGRRVEAHMKSAQGDFQKAKREEEIDKKINHLLDGLDELSQGVTDMRYMMGNMSGIALSAALISERSNKELIKLTKKGKR